MAVYNTKPFLNEKVPFLNRLEKECCCADESQVDYGAEDCDCLECWEKDLQIATNELKEATAKYNKAKSIFDNAYAWENKLKQWIETTKATHEKAIITYAELVLFIESVKKLEVNSQKTILVIQSLVCLVKKIFDLNSRLCIEWEGDVNFNLIYQLKEFIRCHHSLDEPKKQQALVCIESYEIKVKEIYELRVTILGKMLQLLHLTTVIATFIYNEERNFGLKWQLNDLRKRLIQETTSLGKMNECFCAPVEQPDLTHPCGKEEERALLPIMAMEGKGNSDYYKKLSRLYYKAETESLVFRIEMQDARKRLDEITSRKNSLESAINAAEAAEAAK
jgi:hypothetical protein